MIRVLFLKYLNVIIFDKRIQQYMFYDIYSLIQNPDENPDANPLY